MNSFRNGRSLLSHVLVRCDALSTRCYHRHASAHRLMQQGLGSTPTSTRGSSFLPYITRDAVRRASTTPRGTATHSRRVLRWYDDPRKAAAATAITLSAAVMTARSRYDREVVPCTNRSHLVVLTPEQERDQDEALFDDDMSMFKGKIVDPRDPASVRVRLIAERIVHAANRGLGIYDSRDAPMLRVTDQKRPKWQRQPDTGHLRGLKWELILVRDARHKAGCNPSGKILVTTGLLDTFTTDEEIAAILAHEVGHIIARHSADIGLSGWFPPFVRRINSCRLEIEADYIGMLLLGAAGFSPHWALLIIVKAAKVATHYITLTNPDRPSAKKRLQFLSQPKIMEEAMELYREVIAMDRVTDKYPM